MNPDNVVLAVQGGLFLLLFGWLIKHTTDVTKIGARIEQAIVDIDRRIGRLEVSVEHVAEGIMRHDPQIDHLEKMCEKIEDKVGSFDSRVSDIERRIDLHFLPDHPEYTKRLCPPKGIV